MVGPPSNTKAVLLKQNDQHVHFADVAAENTCVEEKLKFKLGQFKYTFIDMYMCIYMYIYIYWG